MSAKPFKWDDVKSLISVWMLALAFSVCALITSVGVAVTRRAAWNCPDNGHSFSARYEDIPLDKEVIETIGGQLSWSSEKINAFEKAKGTKYIRDVCEYCGQTLEADHDTQAEDTR